MRDSESPDNEQLNPEDLKAWIELGQNLFGKKEVDIYANSLRNDVDLERERLSKCSGKLFMVAIVLEAIYIYFFRSSFMENWFHAFALFTFLIIDLVFLSVYWKMFWFVNFTTSLMKRSKINFKGDINTDDDNAS
ncbi:MAG: hypothetical protein OXE98_06220 [Hyphomicrobiales bacterium]|nr:hypothetical protein [Hyphomicrobiales bacterium]MCY4053458.1 hypothetical protein [Hyphomicrobiales bacterium]